MASKARRNFGHTPFFICHFDPQRVKNSNRHQARPFVIMVALKKAVEKKDGARSFSLKNHPAVFVLE